MATLAHKTPNLHSYKAGADLSAKLHTFVKFGTVQGEVIAAGAGDLPCGILYDLGTAGGVAGAMVGVAMPGGGALLKVTATPATGAELKPDADGQGVAVTAASRCSAKIDALGGSAAAGDVVPVWVTDNYSIPA